MKLIYLGISLFIIDVNPEQHCLMVNIFFDMVKIIIIMFYMENIWRILFQPFKNYIYLWLYAFNYIIKSFIALFGNYYWKPKIGNKSIWPAFNLRLALTSTVLFIYHSIRYNNLRQFYEIK